MEKILNFLLCLYFCVLVTTISTSEEGQNQNNITIECSPNVLVVRGNMINMSEILNVSCLEKVKLVEIFAFDTFFLDADFIRTEKNSELAIIAPKWEIIEDRKIVLDGHQPKQFISDFAPFGIGKFKDGKPGKPGGSGGHFIGIGQEFIHGSNLEIHVNGGEGGRGQFGGNGTKLFIFINHFSSSTN